MTQRRNNRRKVPVVAFQTPLALICQAVKAYARYHGTEPETICNRAFDYTSAKYWKRLKFGKVQIQTVESLVQYLSNHWPGKGGPVWPVDLDRPMPQRGE